LTVLAVTSNFLVGSFQAGLAESLPKTIRGGGFGIEAVLICIKASWRSSGECLGSISRHCLMPPSLIVILLLVAGGALTTASGVVVITGWQEARKMQEEASKLEVRSNSED